MNTVLIAFAIVCAVLAAVGVPSGRFNLTAASLAFYFISLIVRVVAVSLVILTLVSCGSTATGDKTFMGKTSSTWGDIFINTGKRAAPILQEEFEKSSSK